MTASHHPSSAELAAFRYRTAHTHTGLWDGAPYHGGAWSHERRDGIGRYDAWGEAIAGTWCRREAGALRSRAFDTWGWPAYGSWHPHNMATFSFERERGIPAFDILPRE